MPISPIRPDTDSFQGGQVLPVRFASSVDVQHADKPKLSQGQEAVLILSRDTLSGAQTPGHMVIEPVDVMTKGSEENVRRILGLFPAN